MKFLFYFSLFLVCQCTFSNEEKVELLMINASEVVIKEHELFELNGIINTADESKENYWRSWICGFALIFVSGISETTFVLSIYYSSKVGAALTFLCTSIVLICLNVAWVLVGSAISLLINLRVMLWITLVTFFIVATFLFVEGLRMPNRNMIEELYELEEESIRKHELEILETDQSERLIVNKDEIIKQVSDKDENRSIYVKQINNSKSLKSIVWGLVASLFLEAFGGRSQITVLAIAGVFDFKGVMVGSCIGHIMTILIAVSIGRAFSEKISEKVLTLICSVLFFIYSVDLLTGNLIRRACK